MKMVLHFFPISKITAKEWQHLFTIGIYLAVITLNNNTFYMRRQTPTSHDYRHYLKL